METTIEHKNDDFLVIPLKQVSGVTGHTKRHRTPKLWEIAHENGHKIRKRRFLVIYVKHVLGLRAMEIPIEPQNGAQ